MYADGVSGFFAAPLWHHLLAFGLLIAAECYFYLKLPLDLIPDFIPLIGRCDDCLAGVMLAFGVAVACMGLALYAMSERMPPLQHDEGWNDRWR
jgi:uncharacterized membrane protein YkvA (DUF1232 family)